MDDGLVELVYNATDKHYTEMEVSQMYNLWSTLCVLPEVAEQMVQQYGELERGVRAMKTHRRGTVRGEVIQVHSTCFARRPGWRARSFDAGVVPELLSAISDEITQAQGELDVIGKDRMVSNAMNWLRLIATDSPELRSGVLAAGTWETVMSVLQDFNAHGGDHSSEHGFAEMQHNLLSEACDLLTQLMGHSPAEQQQLARVGSLPQLRSALDISAGSRLPPSCSTLLQSWPQ